MVPGKVLVVGCGGIGGVVAGTLAARGAEVSVVARPAIARAIRDEGLRLTDARGTRRIRELRVLDAPPGGGGFDHALLAVPPDALLDAAASALPALAPRGTLVCLQNGLPEERLAAEGVAEERILGAVVAFGASSPAPGQVVRTSRGGFCVGRLDGAPDPRAERLGELLSAVGDVQLVSNLRGARWSKLAFNCAVSSLGTLGGERVGPLLRHERVRSLALAILAEAAAVARAEGVRLERIAGTLDLDWLARREDPLRHLLVLAVGFRYRKLRSSMLAGLERGRVPPVDHLNGELVRRGAGHGIATPVNARMLARIRGVAAGEGRPGIDQLFSLHEELRGALALG